jgi:hypothetical protein
MHALIFDRVSTGGNDGRRRAERYRGQCFRTEERALSRIVTAIAWAKSDGQVRTSRAMIPIFILQSWLSGLFSLGVIGGAVYLAHEWQQRSWGRIQCLNSRFAPNFGSNQERMLFAVAMILTLLALAGGTIVKGTTPRSSDCVDPTGPSCRSSSTDPRMALRSSSLTAGAWTPVNGTTSEEIFWTVFEAEVQMGGAAQHLPMDSQVHDEPSAAIVTTAASEAQCTHSRGKAVLFDG